MEMTFKEAVEHLEDGIEVTLTCDGHEYEIGPSDGYVGGSGDGFISLVLGNVEYQDAEHVLQKSMDFLSRDGKEVTLSI